MRREQWARALSFWSKYARSLQLELFSHFARKVGDGTTIVVRALDVVVVVAVAYGRKKDEEDRREETARPHAPRNSSCSSGSSPFSRLLTGHVTVPRACDLYIGFRPLIDSAP
jgi:hypothetical protein